MTKVGDVGHVREVVGPRPGVRFNRTYGKDMTFQVRVQGEMVRSNPINFPLRPGNTWETTLAGGDVVTTLKCKQEAPERLKVGNEELDVIPFVCNGRWLNIKSGNTNTATYKYWYSPVVGANARQTVLTYASQGVCADIEYRLENYSRVK